MRGRWPRRVGWGHIGGRIGPRRSSGAFEPRLVPREMSSGEKQHRGWITKSGNARARWLLVEAAWSVWRSRTAETAGLRAWAQRIAARRGKRVAMVALARKLAGILFAMWRDETCFEPRKIRALEPGKIRLVAPNAA